MVGAAPFSGPRGERRLSPGVWSGNQGRRHGSASGRASPTFRPEVGTLAREEVALADDRKLGVSGTLGKGRMQAFSDGVPAIAITLLVLDLAVRPPGSPFHEFVAAWPGYLAYLISFLTIGAAWIAHHSFTGRLDRVDSVLLRLNLLFLLFVSFLPFPTRLVAEALEKDTGWERPGAVVYGMTLLVIRLLFSLMSAYAGREHLYREGVDDPDFDEAHRKFRAVVIGYVVTILRSLLAPVVAIALYFAIAVFLVVPFRTVGRTIADVFH